MKIAVLTSPNQWFESYAQQLAKDLGCVNLYKSHVDIKTNYNIVFILSYHKLIDEKFLKKHDYNIVIHESDLPSGKGWAPLFWQILEGKHEVAFSMFEAGDGVDCGDIYMQRKLILTGCELNKELRSKQALLIMKMCEEFVNEYPKYLVPNAQEGEETFYPKRCAADSELDVTKSIEEQFNLLRISNNEDYPAFFFMNGKKYILKIELGTEK